MSVADKLLHQLHGVRQRGAGQWSARCPAHDDRSPSLSLKEAPDGRMLLHCFGGCTVAEVVGAAGLELVDLFPPREHQPGTGGKPSRLKLPAAQALEILTREALTVYVVASDLHRQRSVSEADFDRLGVAVRRVGQIVEATA